MSNVCREPPVYVCEARSRQTRVLGGKWCLFKGTSFTGSLICRKVVLLSYANTIGTDVAGLAG